MTVINTTNSVRETGNGSKTDFDYSFKMFETDEFAVFKIDTSVSPEVATLQTLGVDYTATILTVTEGGTITYIVAPTSDEDSFISRLMDLDQPTDIPREANFPEESIENEFDRSRMIDIQQQADIDLKIGFAATSSTTGVTFPEPEAGKAIIWNSAGDDLENSTTSFEDVVTAAAASAAAAAASASAASTSETAAAASATAASSSETAAAASAAAAAASAASIDGTLIEDADQNTKIQVEESPDENIIRMDTAGTERWIMTANGERTMPTQPAFLIKPSITQVNIATGSFIDVIWVTEIKDQGVNFASNIFTAPVTGLYQLNFSIVLGSIDSAASEYLIRLNTSNRNYDMPFTPNFSADSNRTYTYSMLVDMDAADTAKVQIQQTGGTAQTDISSDSFFSGYLVA